MNTVRLAAAGAGKTWGICHEALDAVKESASNRVLMVTYTNRGVDSISHELREQNYGVIPSNVVVISWYQFLMKELIRPYQTYIAGINEIKGFDYSLQHERNFAKTGTKRRYITSSHNVRSEEASNLALHLNDRSNGKVISRLERTYTHIFIDEIQDMAGRDIDILYALLKTRIDITCVGDNKQATFKTHTTRTNAKISGENIFDFFKAVEAEGIATIEMNLCSRRFNESICCFANMLHSNGNNMTTNMTEITGHDGVFLIEKKDAALYYALFHPQELRYNRKVTDICGNFAMNFGECKGRTFERCLIYANNPLIDFLKSRKRLSAPEKYYVALTRAKYSNAIVVEKMFNAAEFEQHSISVDGHDISALRYIGKE